MSKPTKSIRLVTVNVPVTPEVRDELFERGQREYRKIGQFARVLIGEALEARRANEVVNGSAPHDEQTTRETSAA